jgi:hypothetical protein
VAIFQLHLDYLCVTRSNRVSVGAGFFMQPMSGHANLRVQLDWLFALSLHCKRGLSLAIFGEIADIAEFVIPLAPGSAGANGGTTSFDPRRTDRM